MIRNKNQFHVNSEIHQNNTREHANLKMDIHIQSHNTDLYKRSVINMGTKLYNKLPGYKKEIDSYNIFKKESYFYWTVHHLDS